LYTHLQVGFIKMLR